MQCVECGTADQFDLIDGMGYCQTCGTQSQQIRDEVAEFDETVVGYEVARGANKTVVDNVPDILWTKDEALQHVLQEQVKALVTYGYPNSLKTSVGNLWFKFLAKLGRIKVAGITPSKALYVTNALDNLVLLYLALRNINVPLFLSDVIEWVTQGVVPFINISSILPSQYKSKKLFTDMNPKTIPDFATLNKRLTGVIRLLDLPPLIETNAPILCIRLTEALHLPRNIGQIAGAIFEASKMSEDNEDSVGDVQILSSVITAIRLHYQFESETSDKDEWRIWLTRYLESVKGRLLKDVTIDPALLQGEGERTCRLYWGCHPAYFLHMQVSEYISCINHILNDIAAVREKNSEVVSQLYHQFNDYSSTIVEREEERDKERDKGKVLQEVALELSDHVDSCHVLVIYPATLDVVPSELRLLIDGLAARYKVNPSVLFESIQCLARQFAADFKMKKSPEVTF